jgi:glycosyltransferase involved in cell wall biosynthesis
LIRGLLLPRSNADIENTYYLTFIMKLPLVTVGLPFYNSRKSLLNAIRSIFAQTYQNWQLILADDNSDDGSTEIAFSVDDPRVTVIESNGKNLGLPAKLNQITNIAEGYYLARMDADDMSHPLRLAKQIEFLQANPHVDVVGTCSCILNVRNQMPKKTHVTENHEEIFRNKFSKISIVHPSLMAKTQWFRRWPYDETVLLSQDNELWLRSSKDSVFANINELLYFKDEFTSFSLRKYTRAKNILARVTWKYARQEVGTLRAACYAGRHYFHMGAYLLAVVTGVAEKLVKWRYSDLSSTESAEVAKALEIVRKTDVPLKNRFVG